MWNEIINLAVKNGLWAVLFTGLLLFVIKDSSKREKKYQDTIKELTQSLSIVEQIKENVESIKAVVNKRQTRKKTKDTKKTQKSKSTRQTEDLPQKQIGKENQTAEIEVKDGTKI